MKKDRRWLKSAIVASMEETVSLPWQRGAGAKLGALKTEAAPKPRAIAAR